MTYTARVERGERYWLVHILEIDQWTQARTLQEVEPMARDLIGVMQEVPIDSFDLTVQVNLPEAAREKWERSKRILGQIDELKAAGAAAAAAPRRLLPKPGCRSARSDLRWVFRISGQPSSSIARRRSDRLLSAGLSRRLPGGCRRGVCRR
ncbi:hypothetical protein ACWF9G_32865 [Nocardia sp. NPDC055029]